MKVIKKLKVCIWKCVTFTVSNTAVGQAQQSIFKEAGGGGGASELKCGG